MEKEFRGDYVRTVEASHYQTVYKNLPDGGIFLERLRHQERPAEIFDVFGRFWFFLMADVPEQTLCVGTNGKNVTASGPCAALVSPFSLIHWKFLKPVDFRFQAFVYQGDLPDCLPKESCFFPLAVNQWPKNLLEITEVFKTPRSTLPIGKMETYNPLAVRLKKSIDLNFLTEKNIIDYANEFCISRDGLTRYFRKCYGIAPISYRNRLRLSYALFSLLFESKSIGDLSKQAGFKTLKNFNKQFLSYAAFQPSKLKI